MAKPCFACSHCSLDETVSQLHEEIAGLRQENLTLHAELQEIAELRNENLALKGELLTMYRQLNALYGFGECVWPHLHQIHQCSIHKRECSIPQPRLQACGIGGPNKGETRNSPHQVTQSRMDDLVVQV